MVNIFFIFVVLKFFFLGKLKKKKQIKEQETRSKFQAQSCEQCLEENVEWFDYDWTVSIV